MLTYEELRAKQRKEFDALPIGYAYDDIQLKQMMKKLGVKSVKELFYNNGCYYRKVDAALINATIRKLANEFKEALKHYDFAYDAFLYEFANTEYQYHHESGYILEALGLEYDWYTGTCPELIDNPILSRAFVQARTDFLNKIAQG